MRWSYAKVFATASAATCPLTSLRAKNVNSLETRFEMIARVGLAHYIQLNAKASEA